MSAAFTTVHVRVNDAATGRPTPARLRFVGPDGEYLAPLGRVAEFATGRNQAVGGNVRLGAKRYAYIDGGCEIRLPAGRLQVEISKGPAYRPLRQELDFAAGKLALRFALERWTDPRDEGWYAGDVRAHFLTPHAALLEAAAEDLAVVNLLALPCTVPGGRGEYPDISNILAFSGQAPALASDDHLVVVNTLNSHPVLGHLALLNCHRVVYPLTFGGDGPDDWTLADWCDQCHRKGGLVVWAKTAHETEDFRYGEPLADLLLGKVDAFEIDAFEDSVFDVLPDWYRLLDCGFHVPLAGGSGKDSNSVALGAMRTYARLPLDEPFSYRGWVEAVRAGRTFVSNGPILYFTVGDQYPGAQVEVPAGRPVRLRARAQSQVPFERLEVVAGGRVVAEAGAGGDPSAAELDVEWTPEGSGWLAARCLGSQVLPQSPAAQRVFAHTSAVRLRAGGRPAPVDGATAAGFLDQLGRMLEWARTKARCETDRQRQALVHVFEGARDALSRRVTG